ncbi:hypothetical protein [Pediococcus acidilactici]|uniref:hypothetical protein n=1 Tax=Pediococcus acidilactici TaxID=1254 RepID=UPI001F36CA8E|nr:hypothetical protein [Pediococcus acidilactici]
MQQVDLDEAKIIAEVKADDTRNFERLFNKYHPIIKKMRQKYTIRSFDWDDWMQEGRIVFFNSVVNYDADLKITLGAFSKIISATAFLAFYILKWHINERQALPRSR